MFPLEWATLNAAAGGGLHARGPEQSALWQREVSFYWGPRQKPQRQSHNPALKQDFVFFFFLNSHLCYLSLHPSPLKNKHYLFKGGKWLLGRKG